MLSLLVLTFQVWCILDSNCFSLIVTSQRIVDSDVGNFAQQDISSEESTSDMNHRGSAPRKLTDQENLEHLGMKDLLNEVIDDTINIRVTKRNITSKQNIDSFVGDKNTLNEEDVLESANHTIAPGENLADLSSTYSLEEVDQSSLIEQSLLRDFMKYDLDTGSAGNSEEIAAYSARKMYPYKMKVLKGKRLSRLMKRQAIDVPSEESTKEPNGNSAKEDQESADNRVYILKSRNITDKTEQDIFDSIYEQYNIDKGNENLKLKLVEEDETRVPVQKRQINRYFPGAVPVDCDGFISSPITTNINTYSLKQVRDTRDDDEDAGTGNDVMEEEEDDGVDNDHIHHFIKFLRNIRPHIVDPQVSSNAYYMSQRPAEDSEDDKEIEEAEKRQKALENMIKYATILGHVDSFITGRARSVVRALGRFYDDDEEDRMERARGRRFSYGGPH